MIKTYIIGIILVLLTFTSAFADGKTNNLEPDKITPCQISLFSPISYPSKVHNVEGFRFNLIYGKNKIVRGFDIGLIQHTTESSEGIQIGIANEVNNMNGIQYSLIFNHAQKSNGGF